MRKTTICPKCSTKVDVKQNLKYKIRFNLDSLKLLLYELFLPWQSGLESVHGSNIIICPYCGREFNSKNYKYLGLVNKKTFQKIIVAFIAIILGIPLFIFLFQL